MHSVPPASLMVRLQQQQQQQWRQAAAPTSHSSVARRRARRAPDGSVEAPTDHGEWAQSTRDFAAAWWPMEQLRCGSSGSTCSRRSVAMARAVYRVPSVPGRARSGAWPRGDLWDPWGARRDAQRSTRRRPRNSVGAELHVRVGCMSKLHRTLHRAVALKFHSNSRGPERTTHFCKNNSPHPPRAGRAHAYVDTSSISCCSGNPRYCANVAAFAACRAGCLW